MNTAGLCGMEDLNYKENEAYIHSLADWGGQVISPHSTKRQ